MSKTFDNRKGRAKRHAGPRDDEGNPFCQGCPELDKPDPQTESDRPTVIQQDTVTIVPDLCTCDDYDGMVDLGSGKEHDDRCGVVAYARIDRIAELEAENKRQRDGHDVAIKTICSIMGGLVEGHPPTAIDYLQRLRQLTASESEIRNRVWEATDAKWQEILGPEQERAEKAEQERDAIAIKYRQVISDRDAYVAKVDALAKTIGLREDLEHETEEHDLAEIEPDKFTPIEPK